MKIIIMRSREIVQEPRDAALFTAAELLITFEPLRPTACGSAVGINASQAAIVADGNTYVECVAPEPI